jgi:D-ribose pyranose/furanose isomerase RbsD
MKKITLSAIIIISSVISMQAQLYTPTGTILGTSLNSNIGIGTSSPSEKITIEGNHGDTRFSLHSTGGGNNTNEADLMLWASEPGLTYSGVGIGNNVHNYTTNNGNINLLNPSRGGSYIRLLDNSMLFNVVSSSGVNKQALSINTEGNIGIGTTNPSAILDINSPIPTQGRYNSQKWSAGNPGYSLTLQTIWNNSGINQEFIQRYNGVDYTSLAFFQGKIGIGTTNPDEKLTVNGKIHAQEVRIDLAYPMTVPDYVFANNYKLKSLQEVEEFIKQNSHLPEIPSAKEIEKNGLMLAEMNMSLLKKIEELTLYSIEQEKKINTQAQEIETLKDLALRVAKIENELIHRN